MTAPGELFLELWLDVQPHVTSIQAKPWHGKRAAEFAAILDQLQTADELVVPSLVMGYLDGQAMPFRCDVVETVERAFVVMCAVDEAAASIHPAFAKRRASRARGIGSMLTTMKQRRRSDGVYAAADHGVLVPKGNLEERKRPDENSFSGADLAHQFRYLSHVRLPADGRTLKVIVPSPTRFLAEPGQSDRVGVAPIAEDRDDLAFHVTSRLGSPFLDAQPGSVDLHSRIEEAVTTLLDEKVGVILMPELVVPTGSPDRLSAHLKTLGKGSSTLVVAGTGVSTEVSAASSRPYNQAYLMTSNGHVLGIQRKLHPFNMAADRMKDCSIAFAASCDDLAHMEDVTGGEELIILDLEGLGRVMTLICEDIEQQTPSGDIALAMRPDWILTPVLDIALDGGRWTHGRGMEIGRKTWSRLVVSNSSTLAVRQVETNPARIGMAIQTALCLDTAGENRAKFVSRAGAGAPEVAVVTWEPASWELYRTKPA